MMEHMELYNSWRQVPKEAQKAITGGRLNGMTDINPMWRIQCLTERFGPCGMGWKYIIREKRLERGPNDTAAAFVDIDLYYKVSGDLWSEAVPGTGGSAFVARERNGLYLSDECFKMALTDAISVACKALGIGADVYWKEGRSKYSGSQTPPPPLPLCADCGEAIQPLTRKDGSTWPVPEIARYSTRRFGRALCGGCMKAAEKAEKAEKAG